MDFSFGPCVSRPASTSQSVCFMLISRSVNFRLLFISCQFHCQSPVCFLVLSISPGSLFCSSSGVYYCVSPRPKPWPSASSLLLILVHLHGTQHFLPPVRCSPAVLPRSWRSHRLALLPATESHCGPDNEEHSSASDGAQGLECSFSLSCQK